MRASEQEIDELVEASGAERVAVGFYDLETGQEVLRDADVAFHPASIFKVCVMMELYNRTAQGVVSLDTAIQIKNEFASLAGGGPFSLYAEDDSEKSLYDRVGQKETLREINRLMIVQSSNLATNLLIELLTASRVTAFMSELGASDLKILRGPEDNRAFALGLNNSATARGMMQVLRRLAEGAVVSVKASAEMIDVLLDQQYNEGIPAGLLSGMRAAHKTGWNERLYHDAASVLPVGRASFVLVVLTRGLHEETSAPQLVASITRSIVASPR